MTSIQGNSAVRFQTSDTTKIGVGVKPSSDSTSTKAASFKADNIQVGVKKGAGVAFKGAMAGGLGTAGVTTVGLLAASAFKGDGAMIAVPLAVGAFFGGAIGGATSANITQSKAKGAVAGAIGGAIAGGASLGLLNSGAPGSIMAGAVVGGITGAAGGFFGSMVAKQK